MNYPNQPTGSHSSTSGSNKSGSRGGRYQQELRDLEEDARGFRDGLKESAQDLASRFNLNEYLEPVKGYARSAASYARRKPAVVIGSAAAAAIGIGAWAFSMSRKNRSQSMQS